MVTDIKGVFVYIYIYIYIYEEFANAVNILKIDIGIRIRR
jgi:hypothetical protein